MEQQITTLFTQLVADYYKEVKGLLQKENSYERKTNMEAVELLISFMETAIDDNYTRLSYFEYYIDGLHGVLPDVLAPFSFFTKEAREAIIANIKKADEIDRCLKVIKGEEID